MNFVKVKAVFAKDFHIPPSELDKMPAWEYELFMEEVNKLVKEENERNQKEMDGGKYKDIKKMSNPKYAQRMANKQMGNIKVPSVPNASSLGNLKMPKI